MPDGPLRVCIACGGLGLVSRGFETLSRECFDALSGRDDIEVTLVKGGGPRGPRERVARTVHRDGRLAAIAGRALKRPPYWVEQAAFTASLIPRLIAARPQVVYVCEWWVARGLARWKRRTGAGFQILLWNGGPYPAELLGYLDFIQQLTPYALEAALEAGVAPERQALLELGVLLPPEEPPLTSRQRAELRARLDLPADRAIVLAVAALAFHHKRLDYLVREVAALPQPRPHLVMLGQREPETPALLELADSLLGPRGYSARTVPKTEVGDYYRAADVFAHASIWEAFGLVMVEAMGRGLPCVVHDGPTQQFLLGSHAFMGDFNHEGSLAALLPQALEDGSAAGHEQRSRYARERFSWDRLAPRYVEMMRAAAEVGHG